MKSTKMLLLPVAIMIGSLCAEQEVSAEKSRANLAKVLYFGAEHCQNMSQEAYNDFKAAFSLSAEDRDTVTVRQLLPAFKGSVEHARKNNHSNCIFYADNLGRRELKRLEAAGHLLDLLNIDDLTIAQFEKKTDGDSKFNEQLNVIERLLSTSEESA